MHNKITPLTNKFQIVVALVIISSLFITSFHIPTYAQGSGNDDLLDPGQSGSTTDDDSADTNETPSGLWMDDDGILWIGTEQAPWIDDEGVREQYIPITADDADQIAEEKAQQEEEDQERREAEKAERKKRDQREIDQENDGGNKKPPYALGQILIQYDDSLFQARTNELASSTVVVPGGLLDNTESAPAPVGVANEFLTANGVEAPIVEERIESLSVELVD